MKCPMNGYEIQKQHYNDIKEIPQPRMNVKSEEVEFLIYRGRQFNKNRRFWTPKTRIKFTNCFVSSP